MMSGPFTNALSRRSPATVCKASYHLAEGCPHFAREVQMLCLLRLMQHEHEPVYFTCRS